MNELTDFKFFNNLSSNEMEILSNIITRREFDSSVIFEENSTGREIFFILSGEIEIFKVKNDKTMTLRKLKHGEYFGEMGFIIDNKRSACAKAIGKVELLILNKDSFSSDNLELTVLLSKILIKIVETVSNRFISLEKNYMDAIIWNKDISSPSKRIRELIKNETNVKVYYGSKHNEVMGKIISIDEDNENSGFIRLLASDSGWELLIPITSLEVIVTRYIK